MYDAGCAGCDGACDDGRFHTCPLGDAWPAERPPVARVDGRAVTVEEASDAAVAILAQARAPLVYGLGGTSCEAQRLAVAIAEATGAVIDPAGASGAGLAYAAIGSSTATFGEIRDRAELVVVWRADNPRLLERLRPRALVELDGDFETLWELRARVKGAPLRDPTPELDDLARRLLDARHVAFIHGALDELDALALFELVRDLNRDRHAVTLAVRSEGNARGAEDVLAWQTGFPAAVSFARGYPRANPGEFSAAALLERGEVDAALVVTADLPGLRELPLVVVDTHATATLEAARVAFAAVETAGTVHRMDGVPIPFQPQDADGARRPGRARRDRRTAVMLRIAAGRVYDPANGIAGEERDVCVQDGRIVADVPPHARTINAQGMVVMPGGVDIHAHIAGPKVNAARKLAPEEHRADTLERTAITRAGTGGTVPSTFTTGYRYALLGYTTVVDAATPPLAARHTLAELRDTPVIDAAFLVLMGNNLPLFSLIRDDPGTRARGDRVVPAGDRRLRRQARQSRRRRDVQARQLQRHLARRRGPGVTPRSVIEAIATAVHELGLPHPVHVHCNNLGVSGNYRTTLDTLRTLDGRRAHLAHLQFHAYGGKPGGRPRSRAPELAEYLGQHPEISADVGQVMFGPAMTMTADAPVSAVLRDVTHGRWVNADTEAETGCGIVPFTYRERNYVHALQWGIGLELFLLSRDPWRLVLSTDHPNGGSFLSYPRLIRLLMDREFRNEAIRRVNQKAMKRTVLLDDLDREYTLEEIAIITRAGPARLLGLRDKGHLGVGADADITIYDDRADREAMFAAPRYVIKDGVPIVEDGELRAADPGRLLRVGAEYDPSIDSTLEALFEDHYSVQFASYPVREPWLLEPARTVAAEPR